MVPSLGKIKCPLQHALSLSRSFSSSRAHSVSLAMSMSLEDAAGLSDFSDVSPKAIDSFKVSKLPRTITLRHLMAVSPSLDIEATVIRASEPKSKTPGLSTQVKEKIYSMIQNKQLEGLAANLASWTHSTLTVQWSSVLSHNELSYIIGLLVDYQSGLLKQAAAIKSLEKKSSAFLQAFKRAHHVKDLIRAIFANLVNAEDHLYSKTRKQSDFLLSPKDYENIISLELNNGKLDLASQWFRHMEIQHPEGAHFKLMTRRLWLLKFKVYGGAQSSLWVIPKPDLYDSQIKPRQALLKSEMPWMQICDEFSKYQALLLGFNNSIFDNEIVCSMIKSVAYCKNIRQVYGLIQLNWGVLPNGKMDSTFTKPSRDDPLYPDTRVLTTVVLSLIFNEDFRSALAYINGFQDNYDIDLQDSKLFWDQIFRWSDLKTRFNEYRALHVFLRDTGCTAVSAPTSSSQLSSVLHLAQKSPEFDYEGYLLFVNRLRAKREGLLKELWKCYRESAPGFSIRPYQTYYRLVEEKPEENECYTLLTALARESHTYSVSEESYNSHASEFTTKKIDSLYKKTIKLLLDLKGEAGVSLELAPIVAKWSLTDEMRASLQNWLVEREEHYATIQKMKEMRKFMEEEQNKILDDQEKLLDLFN